MEKIYITLWIILTIIFALFEMTTFNLITIWFAAGAFVAVFAAKAGLSIAWQITVFVLVALVLVIATKPLVKKFLKPKHEATNADRVIGEKGIVTETIDAMSGKGQVQVLGSIWSARSDDGAKIEKDTKVVVEKIEGVKIIVSREEK